MSQDDAWQASGMVGKRAGRYLIANALSADPQRELYDAEDVEGATRATVLVVRADGPRAQQVLRQAEKLRSIQHAALAGVLEVGKLDGGAIFVAMERPAGKTLREVAAGERLDQRRALLIIRQVLEALDAAHAAGEIHGNIHPGVIFVLPGLGDDRVKLGELGVAALTKHAADPTYAAPEILRGLLDARADTYAVGAVLYELLTGRPPFAGTDRDALHRLHTYAPVQKLAQRVPEVTFSDALETMVSSALAKKRDNRFRHVRDMIEAIDHALTFIAAPTPAPAASASPSPGEADGPDPSLVLMMEELKRQKAAANAIDVPLLSENVGRQVPVLPWPTRARQTITRWLDRASSVLRIPRKLVGPALAVAGGLVLVVAVAMCSGGDDARPPQQAAVSKPSPTPAPEPESEPDPVGSAPSATSPAALLERCEQLGTACTDTPKRKAKVIDECKQAAAKQVQQGCTGEAISLYECYESKLCGKADKVWALKDLGVLAGRHGKCSTEEAALRRCAKE